MSTDKKANASGRTGPIAHDLGKIRVGRLPTMNQDEYPGLSGWWVQLRIGEDRAEVLARVYGNTPEQAHSRATALAAQPRQALTQQTLDDVKAGIPARDAEIEALRKEIEVLQAQLVDRSPEMQGTPVDESPNLQGQQQPVSGVDASQGSGVTWADAQKLAGMPAVDSALEVFCNGGTAENALALVRAVMIAQQDADKVDAERWRAYRAAAAGEDGEFLERVHNHLSSLGLRDQLGPTEDQIDAAIDAARKEQT